MKRMILVCLVILVIVILVFAAQLASAQIPQTMSYQGLLTDSSDTPVHDDNYSLTFRLYDVSVGGGALWTETHPAVIVVNGIFNVILGSAGSPLNLPFDEQYWLGITVGLGTELTPRLKLTSAAYSLNAQSVSDGAVTTAKLADNSVTTAKIQPNVVSSVAGVMNDCGPSADGVIKDRIQILII